MRLEDLKERLLENIVDKFYVFYGEDYGIRKHYVDRISSMFAKKIYIDNWLAAKNLLSVKTLFTIKQLLIIYNDVDFYNQSVETIQQFINSITDDYVCIFIYDDEKFSETTLFKSFELYITEFQPVQHKIAVEFVEDELNLLEKSRDEMAENCNNLYNNILLDSDKVRNYANFKKVPMQVAYETLCAKNQLLIRHDVFLVDLFMNSVLTGKYTDIAHWYNVLSESGNLESFSKYLVQIFNDFLIANLFRKFEYYDASKMAYNNKLPWGRVKVIRDLELVECEDDYFAKCAYCVAELDGLIKSGKVLRADSFDYFLLNVI